MQVPKYVLSMFLLLACCSRLRSTVTRLRDVFEGGLLENHGEDVALDFQTMLPSAAVDTGEHHLPGGGVRRLFLPFLAMRLFRKSSADVKVQVGWRKSRDLHHWFVIHGRQLVWLFVIAQSLAPTTRCLLV